MNEREYFEFVLTDDSIEIDVKWQWILLMGFSLLMWGTKGGLFCTRYWTHLYHKMRIVNEDPGVWS